MAEIRLDKLPGLCLYCAGKGKSLPKLSQKGTQAMATKIKLAELALPKTGSGRPARTPDADLYAAILDVLVTSPTIPLNGEDRPRVVGDPTRLFDTEGKAVSDARIYRDALMADEKLDGATVRARAILSDPDAPESERKWGWGVYVAPATEKKTEETATA